jgi:hypothetical protein
MNGLSVSRCVLNVCPAAAMLGGCGGSRGPVGAPVSSATMTGTAQAQAASGGALKGKYQGESFFQRCYNEPPFINGEFHFAGDSKVSFLGRSSESGRLKQIHGVGKSPACHHKWNGVVTLTSSKNSENSIVAQLAGGRYSTPCERRFRYTVTSGTGKLTGATGSGTVLLNCDSRNSGSNFYFDNGPARLTSD